MIGRYELLIVMRDPGAQTQRIAKWLAQANKELAKDEQNMPTHRQGSAMVFSPRRPSGTMRVFSSALYWRRVLRLIVRIIFSEPDPRVPDFCLIFAPCYVTGHHRNQHVPPVRARIISHSCSKFSQWTGQISK